MRDQWRRTVLAVTALAIAWGSEAAARSIALQGSLEHDLWVTVINDVFVLPGDEVVSYQVTAGNHGPQDQPDANLTFNVGPGVTVGNWTCEAIGIAQCPTSGTGPIDANLFLPVGDRVTFTVEVSVPAVAEGMTIEALASLPPPVGSVELNGTNNTARLTQAVGIHGSGFEDLSEGRLFHPEDLDRDGWWPALGDCCEGGGDCPSPEQVNPGAFEVLGNGIDDDCRAVTLDDLAATCSSEAKLTGVSGLDLANAMEICQGATGLEPLSTRRWGLLSAAVLNADGSTPDASATSSLQNLQSAVLTEYGIGGIGPGTGATFAGLSTGVMRDANDPGYVEPNTGSAMGRSGSPPLAYLIANGGNLPASTSCEGVCPAGTGANDSVNLRLRLRVPTNANGLSVDYRFLSAEYWQFSCSAFNDYALMLLNSEAPGLTVDRNIAFDAQLNPITVNSSLFDICRAMSCYSCPGGTGALAGTGMDEIVDMGETGGSTGLLRTRAPVLPGEIIELDLMVFDVSDQQYDSVLLLDGFRWRVDATTVGTETLD